ncbi:hypothetical protein [Streptomyces sp. NPDC059378]|uniref:hypothetical protein n=1 Tax=Streptomyces sp. NPDC059378 TaxID=3346815 RepID=UPI0036A83294
MCPWGPGGQAELLKAFGKHLTILGEGWIVIRPNGDVHNPELPEEGHEWCNCLVRAGCCST